MQNLPNTFNFLTQALDCISVDLRYRGHNTDNSNISEICVLTLTVLNKNILNIWELLDDFIYIVQAQSALADLELELLISELNEPE